MRIFIDADSFPAVARQKIIEITATPQIPVIFVANRPLSLPPDERIKLIEVEQGKDKADDYILSHAVNGDIVLSRDLLLAEKALNQNVRVFNSSGHEFTRTNIKKRLLERSISLNLSGADKNFRSTEKNYTPQEAENFTKALRQAIR